jgi:ribosomal protein S18 acetylase RimI-like enzyme
VQVERPTPDRLDETLALLRAADVAVYGDSDWTESELREGWDGLDLGQDAWLVRVDSRLAGVAHLLGVRRAWRRRGLGLALLRDSFRRFRESGETVVALGVDTENATGAVRLYEHAGMRVLWRADVWEKELRAGA